MSASDVRLPLRVGTRTLGAVRRRLVRVGVPLEQALAGQMPALPALSPEADGYSLHGLPASALDGLPCGYRSLVRQRYDRSYAPLGGDWDAYLAGFSAKSRSTLKRKLRRFTEASGGALDIRLYRTADDMRLFHEGARAVSALTYQERRLGAGLPAGPEASAEMAARGARDAVRAFLLFLDGRPVSYLYLPAEGETLIYAYLGYDPAVADLSPGTVLQYAAMERLIGEGRFAYLDFTEGDGQHKRLFGRAEVPSLDLLLLRPTAANAAIRFGLAGFDGAVAAAKAASTRLGIAPLARRLAR